MSLKNILLDVSSVLGLDIADADELAYHISKINEAASELYRSNDLPGCLREQLFRIDDTETFQVAFPSQVDEIRGLRFYDVGGGQISIEDMRPRYHLNRWGNTGKIRFRIKQSNALLSRSINNAALFTFTLKEAEASDVVINVIGKTTKSSKYSETLTIAAGSLAATTTKSYEEFSTIEKTALNNFDITITDVDNEIMGEIKNFELSPRYTIAQIREDDFAPLLNNSYPLNTVECLYKTTFYPFRSNYDEFPCRNCDKLIAWKFIEHYAIFKGTVELQQLAINAATKVEQLLLELNRDNDLGRDLKAEFARNPMFEAQKNIHNDFPFIAPTPLMEYTIPQ